MQIQCCGFALTIDEADAPLLDGLVWVRDMHGRAFTNSMGGRVFISRYLVRNVPAGMVVDHVNGDVLDNRRANLRICTHAENMRNTKLSTRNTSGFKGVSWDSHRNAWTAQIKYSGKVHWLGRFASKEDAAKAYAAAANEHHGEFVRDATLITGSEAVALNLTVA